MEALTIGTKIDFIAPDGCERYGRIIEIVNAKYKVRTDFGSVWRSTHENILSIHPNITSQWKPNETS